MIKINMCIICIVLYFASLNALDIDYFIDKMNPNKPVVDTALDKTDTVVNSDLIDGDLIIFSFLFN
jgi:hypothetical protein